MKLNAVIYLPLYAITKFLSQEAMPSCGQKSICPNYLIILLTIISQESRVFLNPEMYARRKIMPKISKETLNDLKKSNLNQKDAEMMKIRDIAPEEMDEIYRTAYMKIYKVKPKSSPNIKAYEIPYLDFDGNPTGYARYKLLETYIPDSEKKPRKYLQLPGTKNKFYFPPFCNWSAITADAKQEIYIVEGEKKAAALTKLGFPAIGLGGVSSWKSRDGEFSDPIADFNLVNWENRKTYIVFDADV